MTITITAEERDALYDQILIRLSGIGDVWIALEAKNYELADRLGREYSDDLRLVLDDLGWGEGSGESLELTTPAEVLRRVFRRLRDTALSRQAVEERERAEARTSEERNRRLLNTCRRVLTDLEEGETER
ncbi:MAG TPA: hypothetical protein VGC49_12945 [Solirubrobacterales bacterium]|jgi:hypothetical protein